MASHIGRRKFLATLGGAAAAWPLATRAQQTAAERTVGILMAYSASDRDLQARVTAFRQDLRKLGWVEGGNLRIDDRWPSDDLDRIRVDAAELIARVPGIRCSDRGSADARPNSFAGRDRARRRSVCA